MRVLAVNVGSTSVKLRVIGEYDRVEGSLDLPPLATLAPGALHSALVELGSVDAIGHRIVHGGVAFTSPVALTASVVASLRALTDLAPLHQPPALDAVSLVALARPDVPAVACFDTAFHATLPDEASTYAVPLSWRELGARRYGFHGLSHSWASERAASLLAGVAFVSRGSRLSRVVTCHLGGGGSLAAVLGGRCVDTSMGFTPLDGLVMATRSGSVDPGLILWLQQDRGLSTEQIADDLEHRSGLVGLCGTADMREVTVRVSAGDPLATLAFGVYVHRLRSGIAAMAASLDGLDAVVFTGGIGQGSAAVRAAACAGLGFLGIEIDALLNASAVADQSISAAGSTVAVFVVEAREDLVIAAGVRGVIG